MESLDRYLIAHILRHLPSPLDAPLRATCHFWRNRISRPQRRTANRLLEIGARANSVELCICAREHGARDFKLMFFIASVHGHREICILARKWIIANEDRVDYDIMLCCVAYIGRRDLCILARDWCLAEGRTPDYDGMRFCANRGGLLSMPIFSRAITTHIRDLIDIRNHHFAVRIAPYVVPCIEKLGPHSYP